MITLLNNTIAIQNLNEKVNKSSKTLYYRHFKTLLDVERYLSIDLPYLYFYLYLNLDVRVIL